MLPEKNSLSNTNLESALFFANPNLKFLVHHLWLFVYIDYFCISLLYLYTSESGYDLW